MPKEAGSKHRAPPHSPSERATWDTLAPAERAIWDGLANELNQAIAEAQAAGRLPPARHAGCVEEVDVRLRPRFDDAEHLEPAHALRRACELAIDACADVDRRAAANDFQKVGSAIDQMDAQQFARHHGHAGPLMFDTTPKPAWWWIVDFESAWQRFMWYEGKNEALVATARSRRGHAMSFAGCVALSAIDCVMIALVDRYGAILKASTPDRYTIWLDQIKKPPFIGNTPSLERFRCAPMLSPGAVGIYSAAVFRKLRSLPSIAWQSLRDEVTAELSQTGQLPPPSIQPPFRCVAYLGHGKLKIGDEPPFILEGQPKIVLEALLKLGGAADKGTLASETKIDEPHKVLKKLAELLAKKGATGAVTLPGGRGRGGYQTSIVDKRPK